MTSANGGEPAAADPVRVSLELTWPAFNRVDDERLRGHLAKTYDRMPSAIVPLDNAWRVDWSDEAQESWIVRVLPNQRPVDVVRADVALLRHLAESPVPVERLAHELAVSEMDGRAIVVTECETGAEAPDTGEVWIALGDLAGRLAALPLPPSDIGITPDVGAYPNYTPRPALDDEFAHVTACLRAVEGDVPAEHADLYDAMRAYLDSPTDFGGLPRGFVHPDLGPANAFATPGGGLVLVDWASAGVGPRIGTLAVLLAYTTWCKDRWLPDRARALISAFTNHLTLDEAEETALADLAERRLFVREAIGLCIGIRFGIPPLSRHQWTSARTAIATITELAADYT